MLDDMRMRKLEPKTQAGYLRAVRHLAAFLKGSPDTATVEDLRRFQLHMVDRGTSPITLNATITGLKFFFDVTLDRGDLMAKMQPVRVPQKLPVVLSRADVAGLIAAAPNLKSQTALSIAYGAGLRASEVIALKVGDIDSQRMILRVEQGKGRKDRYAMLSPVLLERLRAWWRVAHAQGKMLPNGWPFPGLNRWTGDHASAQPCHPRRRRSRTDRPLSRSDGAFASAHEIHRLELLIAGNRFRPHFAAQAAGLDAAERRIQVGEVAVDADGA